MKPSGPILTSPHSPWILNKILLLLLAGTFLGLTGDLRYEHVDKVRHTWTAWIPIAFSIWTLISVSRRIRP